MVWVLVLFVSINEGGMAYGLILRPQYKSVSHAPPHWQPSENSWATPSPSTRKQPTNYSPNSTIQLLPRSKKSIKENERWCTTRTCDKSHQPEKAQSHRRSIAAVRFFMETCAYMAGIVVLHNLLHNYVYMWLALIECILDLWIIYNTYFVYINIHVHVYISSHTNNDVVDRAP